MKSWKRVMSAAGVCVLLASSSMTAAAAVKDGQAVCYHTETGSCGIMAGLAAGSCHGLGHASGDHGTGHGHNGYGTGNGNYWHDTEHGNYNRGNGSGSGSGNRGHGEGYGNHGSYSHHG